MNSRATRSATFRKSGLFSRFAACTNASIAVAWDSPLVHGGSAPSNGNSYSHVSSPERTDANGIICSSVVAAFSAARRDP